MTAQLAPTPVFKGWANDGTPLAFGKLFSYIAGTTTKQATYTDYTQTTPNTNPIILNSRGECALWLDPALSYKLTLSPSNDTDPPTNPIPGWPVDQINGSLSPSASIIPSVDNVYNLGSATNRWANAYIYQNLYIGVNNEPVYDLTNNIFGYIGRTATEAAASVTPTNYGYAPGPTIDPRRYHIAGTIGTAADDLASINTAISVMKQLGGGQIIIPPEYSSSMAVPVLGLSASQAGSIRDLRLEVSGQLGAIVETIEARDGSGGYASEWQIRGHQNPGVVLQTLSDGTAPGYTKVNYACSFVGRTNAGGNNFQLLVDPYFLAYRGEFSLIAYPGSGTFSEAVYVGADANSKNRWNFQTNRFSSTAGTISATTNATPIVVTLTANHNVPTGQYCNVGITGTGITGLDGSWKASATAVNQFTLLNSTAPGSTASSGTCTFYPRTMRAILNVPAVQGGTESISQEGSNVIFTTTAAVGWVLKDLTDTLIGGLTYNTGPAGMRATGIKGISQSTTVANNLAGTDTFSAATTKVVTFANNETNANYRVMITWTADPGAGVRWWVSGKGTTGFTVNVSTANSATFDWMIIRD